MSALYWIYLVENENPSKANYELDRKKGCVIIPIDLMSCKSKITTIIQGRDLLDNFVKSLLSLKPTTDIYCIIMNLSQ